MSGDGLREFLILLGIFFCSVILCLATIGTFIYVVRLISEGH